MAKRVNRKSWARLQELHAQLVEEFSDPARQSHRIWRGDYRAIEWACWWIRESIADGKPAAFTAHDQFLERR